MDNRTPLIAGNWKMYKTYSEAVETAEKLDKLVADTMDVDIMIVPIFTALDQDLKVVMDNRVGLGVKNLHWEKKEAYTGEISGPRLIAAECRYVIIGQSRRRQVFGETDETVNKRIRAAIDAQLVPVFCLSEIEAEHDAGHTFAVLEKQVKIGLKAHFAEDLGTFVIAYEPVWAIDTGKTATKDQAQEAHQYIWPFVETEIGRTWKRLVKKRIGSSYFSSSAFRFYLKKISQFNIELLIEAVQLSKKFDLDLVSACHVKQAFENLALSKSRKFFKHIGTIGGIFLGTAISTALSMIVTNQYSAIGTFYTTIVGIFGAFAIAIDIAKE